MSAQNQTIDEATCRTYARDNEQAMSFEASGSPKFVGASIVAAAVVQGISEAVKARQNFSDCMEIKGYIPLPDQTAPVAVAAATPLPAPAQPASNPAEPQTTALVTAQTETDTGPAAITEIYAMDVNPVMATVLKIKPNTGAYVTSIVRSGPPSDGDLQPGDIILAFGNTKVHRLDDLGRQMGKTHTHQAIRTLVRRDDGVHYVMAQF